MSIFSRIKANFRARANQVADQMEDPKASLDYSLARLEEIHGQMKRSLVDISAARQRLEEQRGQLAAAVERQESQARAALNLGREDLARIALQRKQETALRLQEIDSGLNGLERQVETLKESQAALERRIALFRSKKEELKAVYDAAKAQIQVREAVYGLSDDLDSIGSTIQRVETRIREMQSRADAIDGLAAEGILDEPLQRGQDDIDRELARLGRSQAIEEELALLKASAAPQLTEAEQKRLDSGKNQA